MLYSKQIIEKYVEFYSICYERGYENALTLDLDSINTWRGMFVSLSLYTEYHITLLYIHRFWLRDPMYISWGTQK